jgi:hypothetical protein
MVSLVTAEDIYQAYPRKEKKPRALSAIAKAMKKCTPALLLERTKAYAAAIAWQDRQFIPHPATWFNDEQFNDDPAEWQQPAPQFNATPPPGTSTATAEEFSPAAIVGIYPRRERTAEAADEVSRQIKAGADPADIMAGTRAAAAEIMSQPGGHLNAYVPSALSFFRDRRWADDPAAMFRNQAARANGAPHTKLDLGGRRPASETIID